MFGDKRAGDDFITDPGATVGTESIGSTPEAVALQQQQLEERLEVIPSKEISVIKQEVEVQPTVTPEDGFKNSGPGTDSQAGVGEGGVDAAGDDVAAMSLGDGQGVGPAMQSGSSGSGAGEGVSMNLSQAVTEFLGEGDAEGQGAGADGDAKGQASPGQGAGDGGEAALGEDQSPDTQRKRGLLLQPMQPMAKMVDEAASSSKLLKNLSEGTLLGTNLLDALALGAGVLYALYAPKAVETSRKGLRGLVDRFRNQVTGNGVKIPEKQVVSVFAMRMPNGSERLIAAKLGMGTMQVLAQQDLPTDAGTQKPGSQTQVDFAVKQLTNKLGERTSDVLLIAPQLSNQRSLLETMAAETRVLDTSALTERLKQCDSQKSASQGMVDKPSSTLQRAARYQRMLAAPKAMAECLLSRPQWHHWLSSVLPWAGVRPAKAGLKHRLSMVCTAS